MSIQKLKKNLSWFSTEGGIDETSFGMEAANVAISSDPKIISKRVQNSNADKLELAGPVSEQQQQQQRLLPTKSFVRTRTDRRKRSSVGGSNSGRDSPSFSKGQRSIEVVSESVFAENLESTEHFLVG